MPSIDELLLEVQGLKTVFRTEAGEITAVDDVSFPVYRGRTICVVGESGCGKSVTSLSIMRLIPNPPGRIAGGKIIFKGQDLLSLPMSDMRRIRGNEISMIFQEPMTSLNPVFTIGNQVTEAVLLHQNVSKSQALARAVEMLQLVGIPAPEKRLDDYPHQLSGGMRQRVMIAMALSCNPSLLIADEPTTALDVTIQAQILDLLRGLQKKVGMGLILITHDLGVVAEMADDVVVMYAGKIVEQGTVDDIFYRPQHPYTRGLLNSIPVLAKDEMGRVIKKRLEPIPGIVPSLSDLPAGCRFQDRCRFVEDRCKQQQPPPKVISGEQRVRHEVSCIHDWGQT